MSQCPADRTSNNRELSGIEMGSNFGRRRFLGLSAGVIAAGAVAPSLLGGFSPAYADVAPTTPTPPAGDLGVGALVSGDAIIVMIFLDGGNDTLNTVIPYGDPAYYSSRPVIGIPSNQVLPLDTGWGVHPNLPFFQTQWNAGKLALIHGCGYPDYNRSHFESRDIIESGTVATPMSTGWIGRWLTQSGTDPLRAVSVGAGLPKAMMGDTDSGLAISIDTMNIYRNTAWINGFRSMHAAQATPTSLGGREATAAVNYLNARDQVNTAYTTYPRMQTDWDLVSHLEGVSRLIRGGLPTRVYWTAQGGYDTHDTQLPQQGGQLAELNTAVQNFYASLAGSANASKVVVCVWSEFGRNVRENDSAGTDHGEAYTMMVLGNGVHGGHYGDPPSVTNTYYNALRTTVDYRAVFASLVGTGLGFDPNAVFANCPAAIPVI